MLNVIIPVAGKGTRLMPLTKYYPKAMLPIGNTPALQLIIESIQYIQPKSNIIVVKSDFQELETFFDSDIRFVNQLILDGPLRAIYEALPYVNPNWPTLIHLGDTIFDLETLAKVINSQKDALSTDLATEDYSRFCLIGEDSGKIYDKPAKEPKESYQALSGLYYFTDTDKFRNSTLTVLQENVKGANDEFQISQMLEKYIAGQTNFTLLGNSPTEFGTIPQLIKANVSSITRAKNKFELKLTMVKKSSKNSGLIKEAYHMKALRDNWPELIPETDVVFGKHGDNEYYQRKIKGETLEYHYLYDTIDLYNYFNEVFSFIKQTFHTESFEKHDVKAYMFNRDCVELEKYLKDVNMNKVFTHGDLHLANIVNSKEGLKFIDASGSFFHSKYYDLAKMLHSFYNYNLVKNNLFYVKGNRVRFLNLHLRKNEKSFLQALLNNFNDKEIKQAKILTMIMFKAIIPVHHDNKLHQKVFEAIHLKLKKEIDAGDFRLKKIDEVSL